MGADGVLTLLPGPDAGRLHIYNADGSEAEMCGNGLRCAVLYAASGAEEVRFSTAAGPRSGRCLDAGQVRTDMGPAVLQGRVPLPDVPEALEPGWRVSMGNPHLVVWIDGDPRAAAERHGARLGVLPAFPEGVNVGFARLGAAGAVDLVVYERGSGITQACGTGAAAAAAAARASGRSEGPVRVHLPGGSCRLFEVDGRAELEGPARIVFRGELELGSDDVRQRE